MNKSTLENGYFSKRLKIKQNTAKSEADFCTYSSNIFDFRLS